MRSIELSWTSMFLITLDNYSLLMISMKLILHINSTSTRFFKDFFFFSPLLMLQSISAVKYRWLDSHEIHPDAFYISLCKLQLPLVTSLGLTRHVVINWLIDYWNSWPGTCISWYLCLSCQQITTWHIKEKYKETKLFWDLKRIFIEYIDRLTLWWDYIFLSFYLYLQLNKFSNHANLLLTKSKKVYTV